MPVKRTEVQTKGKPSAKSTALVPFDVGQLEDMGIDINEVLREQMEGVKVTFPITKILHAGARSFEMPDGEVCQEFLGVLLFRHRSNAYWEKSFSEGGGSPPDCFSLDALTGSGDPGGDCETCENNEFDSAKDAKGKPKGGKACKNTERIYILRDLDEEIPMLMIAPPTSLRPVANYMARLTSQKIPSFTVWTRFSVVEAINKDKVKFSRLVLEKDDGLDAKQMQKVIALRNSLMTAMKTREVKASDMSSEDNTSPPPASGRRGRPNIG